MDDERYQSSIRHARRRGFALKRITLQCIQDGDVDGMSAMFSPRENVATISGALSDDLGHATIACLFTWAQAEGAAEAGGLSEEEGSALFYAFASKAREATDVIGLLELDRQALVGFAQAVDERNRREGEVGPVMVGMRFIDRHLYDGVSAQQVADRLHFSEDYLSRQFRRATGKTLASYIRGRKIDDAKVLLESSRLEVSEIGSRLGFSTHSHFTSVFRKLVGMTPSEYRRQAREGSSPT